WAMIGYLTDRLAELDAQTAKLKPRKGRPPKNPHDNIDANRARALWRIAHVIGALTQKSPHDPRRGVKITTRQLIQLAKDVVPASEGLFEPYVTDTTIEQSVSRGRSILEIDDEWRSKVCEKEAGIFPQIT
ncbi:unnamed protein product, partial [marine sediment metagenome]